jgi:hypothetical protein
MAGIVYDRERGNGIPHIPSLYIVFFPFINEVEREGNTGGESRVEEAAEHLHPLQPPQTHPKFLFLSSRFFSALLSLLSSAVQRRCRPKRVERFPLPHDY